MRFKHRANPHSGAPAPQSLPSHAPTRRRILKGGLAAWMTGAAGLAHRPARAADGDPAGGYPARTIRIVVPYAPGGGTDMMARMIATGMTERLGKAAYIDNRAGAGTSIGSQAVAMADPDGYTLLITTGTFSVLPALYRKLAFDPVKDFAPVTLFATSPNVLLVPPDMPVRTFAEFVAYVKSRPEPLAYASSGIGGTGHLAMEQLKQMTGMKMTHIPYNGGGPALQALLSHQVAAMINNEAQSVAHIKAGRLRAVAVTSAMRSPTLPDVPTIAESGYPNFDAQAWFGVLVPAHTPPGIVDKLSMTINTVVRTPKVAEAFAAQGVEVTGSTPAEFAKVVRDDVVRWRKVIAEAGIEPN
ncbi:Bug family tripartite tricarboxylate transporter substrate binding protein [Achromobacter aloeverae]